MAEIRAGTTVWTPPRVARRTFLAAGAGLMLPLAGLDRARAALPGVPADGKIDFKVFRDGGHIGQHTLRFEQEGDGLTIQISVRIVIRVGPVPVYHHTQHCTERWRGDHFVSLDSLTASTAARQTVTARREADGIHIQQSDGGSYTAPADALPQTHWNHFAYQGPLFNPENGKMLKETVVGHVEDMVKLADGSSIRATRYSMIGDGIEEDYYDAAGVWAGLHARVQDGSYVDYLRE
jgi:hypothetical protein